MDMGNGSIEAVCSETPGLLQSFPVYLIRRKVPLQGKSLIKISVFYIFTEDFYFFHGVVHITCNSYIWTFQAQRKRLDLHVSDQHQIIWRGWRGVGGGGWGGVGGWLELGIMPLEMRVLTTQSGMIGGVGNLNELWPDNRLLSDSTKSLPKQILTDHQ